VISWLRFRGLYLMAVATTLFVSVVRADVKLAALFGDGLVLQRGRPVRIWGSADAGEKISVHFAGQTATATAAADGSWSATLPEMRAATVARDLHVRGKNTIVVRNVLVGDVWICSGQSNMEMDVGRSLDAAHEIAMADFPAIRQIKIGRQLSERPLTTLSASGWEPADPTHVGRFTAAGYYFARTMFRENGVPIGLINCTWSGTPVEPWISAERLYSNPAFQIVWDRWQADLAAYPERKAIYEKKLAAWQMAERRAASAGDQAQEDFLKTQPRPRPPPTAPDYPYPGNPTQIYNGMVYPLRQTAIRGVLWYQGEANAVHAPEYAALFQACIQSWRTLFNRSDLPFYWVQIANYSVDTDWARLREAQTAALALPSTGMAVSIDIGDPFNIHPANKQDVGRRLALIAQAKLEGRTVEFSGPLFAHADFVDGAARVSFTHAEGLNARCGPAMSLELAGEDRNFHPAEGRIEGDTLVVSASEVPRPVAVRYAWSASPHANLYNKAGLPAVPFRSDTWPP
jgi:sialate O-acetylesterase